MVAVGASVVWLETDVLLSLFPLSLPQERMALDDHVKGSKGGDKDVHVMHEFIRKQAINQQADYSVRV